MVEKPAPDPPPPVHGPMDRYGAPGVCAAYRCGWQPFTWVTPNDGRRWCADHLREVLRRAWMGAPR